MIFCIVTIKKKDKSIWIEISTYIKKNVLSIYAARYYLTLTKIDSKSASEESQVCIAIAGLYISLSGLS